ncbi:hypothetical protein MMAD_44190 [Mycolicibacterium madagascariense]|uniref:Uncharacterized protein n=1 Tax=Mycolicibacterium madagascariense TaxID=212765 RepID=A0A7I7XLM8_9MYCO|nr:hypothetical protein [Mycolicibacterium madagascariense]MCV7012448.1 hypothetical protein [Mycolicibacterium madagascariense]BBZ30124.1 hypothetical protein MMAD_44190 [Mycolicibacterium madagascariense]
MATTDTDPNPTLAWAAAALDAVSKAGRAVSAAKRTKSRALVARANRELRDAVDAARDVGVEWGEIGTALGIARGNAYQRYRKRPDEPR